MLLLKCFKLFNKLYKYCYPVYRPFYFLYKRISDREKVKMIKQFVKPGMVVLDIGANIGFYTILLSRLVGDRGKVYAFEPERGNFKKLIRNTKKLKNVKSIQAAVGEKNKKIKLYLSKDLNVDHRTFPTSQKLPHYEVDCIAIDNYINKNTQINFIKLDIQGYDYFGLQGMKNTVKNSKKLFFIGEYWPWGINKSGGNNSDFLQLLKNLNLEYKFFDNEKEIMGAENDENKYFDLYAYKN